MQHVQKALTPENVQLASAISDLSGVTGMAIVRAILAGTAQPKGVGEIPRPADSGQRGRACP